MEGGHAPPALYVVENKDSMQETFHSSADLIPLVEFTLLHTYYTGIVQYHIPK